ncbi:MAG: hypothetical protein ACYC8T_26685 [Myxococcaceae bacterium]
MRGWRWWALAACLASAHPAAAADRVSVFVRGGLGDYTGPLGRYTGRGPVWGLTVSVQRSKLVGVELAYEGSRNDLGPVVTPQASLLRNGGSALVKIGPQLIGLIRPFVGFGVGASNMSVLGERSEAFRSDWSAELPLTAGVEFNTRRLTAGIRGTYRLLPDQEVATNVSGGGGNFRDVSATLGGRF